MKNILAGILALGLTAALLGCSQSPQDGHGHDHEEHAHASATPKAAETVSVTPTPGQKVEVAAEGTEFAPPVPVGAIPDGTWACVMAEKVHYASADKGEGKCAVCGMNLVEVGAEE